MIKTAVVKPHHGGFGMYDAGPWWTIWGEEEGPGNYEDATLSDWLSWVRSDLQTDIDEAPDLDGKVYGQRGKVYRDENGNLSCAYEMSEEEIAEHLRDRDA